MGLRNTTVKNGSKKVKKNGSKKGSRAISRYFKMLFASVTVDSVTPRSTDNSWKMI